MVLTLTAALAAISLGLFAQATPPARINYQGVLRDASGNPLSGSQTMTFRFYDAASGGNVLWEETYSATYPPQITVSSGLFTVSLGNAAHRTNGSETLFPNVFALHPTVYLAVAVGLDPEMTPRIQVVSAPFAENCDTLDGKHATDFIAASSSGNFLNTSSTAQTKAEKLTLNGATDYGISASGPTAGGYFWNSNNSGYAYVGIGDVGISAYGNNAGGYFKDSNNSGYAYVGYGDVGIDAYGNYEGGYFHGPNSGKAYVGYNNDGIDAYGNNAGGYFKNSSSSGEAYVAVSDDGIRAYGNTAGGYFGSANASGYAYVGTGDDGIDARGNTAGGYFADLNNSGYAFVACSTYKIYGSGTVSFVQNHPTEKDKVIVYACPEGDEVATYTRGTAKLVNGEARVKLGDTFKWVTNPDIGLTAHLTPVGDWSDLYVASKSTTELVVRSHGGAQDAAFDYIVYGLRIGFEESSIVQEKQQESYIPSFKDHRERYAKYPELRAFNALERFKTMESSVRGVEPASIYLSRAKALHDAIHEYDPATDPPVDKLFGHDHGAKPADAGNASNPSPSVSPKTLPPLSQPLPPSYNNSVAASSELAGSVVELKPALPCFASVEVVEAGDVITMDPSSKGYIRRCTVMADPLVVGIAAGPGDNCAADSRAEEVSASNRVPVSTSGIVFCKVDATYGAIREGDLLVSSPTPGHAMRAENPAQGTVIGKALEPLPNGTGLIKVLVMLR
jgi:hypothetical protein